MFTSNFCIQKRQQERQRLKKLLIFGFASSGLFHGILAYAVPRWSIESPKTEKPMELIIVDKPKPKDKPQPEPKIESKPVVEPEPKPQRQPEPVKAKTPPPPVKPPEPVKTQTSPPKPTPQKVLTSPTPAATPSIVSAPIQGTARQNSLSQSFTAESSSVSASSDSSGSNPGTPGTVAIGSSAPPRPEPSTSEGISCVSNCEPEYPAALEGAEGSAGVKLTIDAGGNVIGAKLASANSNSQLNRQALLAARKMKFDSPPGGGSASVRVKIDFTVAGSEYDRAARQEQREREQLERERQQQEAARQQQLEQEKQARQEQLERERQAETQQQQPVLDPSIEPKPMPTTSETEVDSEMLRKFRERIEQHQQE